MKRILSIFMIVAIICLTLIPIYGEEKVGVNLQTEIGSIKFSDTNLELAIREIINKPQGEILLKDVENIKKLHVNKKNISNLEGIQYLTNLEELFLKENSITDITHLAGLEKLKALNLWKNNVRDITSLKGLRNLKILDLDSNKIENIEPLKELYNLKALRLGSNRLTDISPLANLNELEYLCLWSNRITDIKYIGGLTKLNRLRLAYNEIKDIGPLANLSNLENINLLNNKISDVNALSNMTNLKSVYLMRNEIRDISPLANLKNLERLRLDYNKISNIEPLRDLNELKLLTLSENNISDINPLEGMGKLEYLNLNSNKIISLDALVNINGLVKLLADENNIYNVRAVSDKQNLTTLSLSHNNLSDLSPLTSLGSLKYLDVSNNVIQNVEPLKENTKLEKLFLQKNRIKAIDSISTLTNLRELNISENLIYDINPLKNNINLRILKLYNNRIQDLSALLNLKNLEVIRTIGYVSSRDAITIEGKITDIYNDENKGEKTYINMTSISNKNNRYIYVTNEFGEFKISGVFPGEYKISLTKKGYKPLTIYKNFDSNNKRLSVKLEEASGEKWITNKTDRMMYKHKEGIEISRTEIMLQEKKLSEIEEFFSVKVNGKIEYNICTYPEEIYELAYNIRDRYALGTYNSETNAIYSLGRAFDFHETCHAVEFEFNPNFNISLGEGLAVYFERNSNEGSKALDRPADDLILELMIKGKGKSPDLKALLKDFKGGNDYMKNGSFVNFLLKRYSVKQFRELFKILPNKPSDKEIDNAFDKVYNKSTTDIQYEWIKYIENNYGIQVLGNGL
ncbi:leucine-rich repeat domain-containing protein [Wukongibacter baidiensis]|uniref:leucine-rich repeat domain-containing protein n=1 Tax=Wukongibacter baidiensis TaxID=1723361 RepID=UPI003D7FB4F2